MPGKKGGTAKPSDQLKKKTKEYDEVDQEFLQKQKDEAAKIKALKEQMGKKK